MSHTTTVVQQGPGHPTVTTPCLPGDRHVVTTTVQESKVRAPRVRLFVTGFLQLIFGGFALIPVCLLCPHPLIICTCAWLAFTGMIGILGACASSSKSSTSVKYDATTRTQSVVTVPPMFPRFYVAFMVIGFLLALASAALGIWILSNNRDIYIWVLLGPLMVGLGIFFCLMLMITVCCVSPMVRSRTTSSEQVHVVATSPPPAANVPGAYGAYSPNPQAPYQAGPSSNMYPYIDEPVKEGPPSYYEATREEQTNYPYPQKQPSAPDL